MNARLAMVLAATLALLHALSYWGTGPIDDDFICFRYARNLVEGHGLVFNAGQQFEGYTTPGWTLWMAVLIRLDLDPAIHGRTIGVLMSVATTVAVGLAWRVRFPSSKWVAPAWIVAAAPPLAWHAIAGLGTTTMAACLALFFLEWERASRDGRAPRCAAAWLATACFVRQECALFVLPFLWAEWRSGRIQTIVTACSTLIGWTVYRWFAYGRLLPITYDVKKLPVGDDVFYGVSYLLTGTLLLGIAPLVFLAMRAPRGCAQHRSAPLVGVSIGLLLHTVYVVWVGGDFMPWARFFVPTFPLAVLLACVALRRMQRFRMPLVVLGMLALQWTALVPLQQSSALGRVHRIADHEVSEAHWLKIGAWMHDVAPPGTRVATSPIGAIGWASELEVIDILGLTHDGALGVPPNLDNVDMKGHHRTATEYVLARMPEWVLLGNGWTDGAKASVNPWEHSIVLDPRFQSNYRQVGIEVEGIDPFFLFIHNNAPLPQGAKAR